MASTYLRRAQRYDRFATRVITAGGIAVIVSVVLILVLIVREALPLFYAPSVTSTASFPIQSASETLAIGLDEYALTAFTIGRDAWVRFYNLDSGELNTELALEPPEGASAITSASPILGARYSALWDNGATSILEVMTRAEFDSGARRLVPRAQVESTVTATPEVAGSIAAQMRQDEDGMITRVDLLAENRVALTRVVTSEDVFGESQVETKSTLLQDDLPGIVVDLSLDSAGHTLYAATDSGFLVRWDLRDPEQPKLLGSIRAFDDGRTVTAIASVLGDVSLAVGDDHGGLVTWSPVRSSADAGHAQLRANHVLAAHDAAVTEILPSPRDKSLVTLDAAGVLHWDHMTSERHLLSQRTPSPIRLAALAPRGDGFAGLDSDGTFWAWRVNLAHPEASLRTLFTRVWYENYEAPAFAWQSSASGDDFEPKLSLVPLVFGSLKGTLYAMVYAVPLALFGAVYVSQFAADRVRGVVKPAVEIMAALPSVVVGFMCALWLAPLVEARIVSFLLAPFTMLVMFLLFVALWQWVRRRPFAKRVERGYEFLVLFPVLLCGVYAAYLIGPQVERILIDGDFSLWLFHEAGQRYDQRNSIVIAFGLGFAVIPIIFTIADDAISSVPHSLKAASLAMGATRWQTVWRVVLPAASPGIFAGMMIGFGRAVGETMIVLMATGNTPIMDWSIFNGMRTLSANIAVEIPEAPVDSTLYRVLFLSAVLLFALTFTVNTVAELVRQSLRKKYGRFQ